MTPLVISSLGVGRMDLDRHTSHTKLISRIGMGWSHLKMNFSTTDYTSIVFQIWSATHYHRGGMNLYTKSKNIVLVLELSDKK